MARLSHIEAHMVQDQLVAREVMTPNPLVLPLTASVREGMEALAAQDVRHVPVVNEDGELVGILSDRDLRKLPFASADMVTAMGDPVRKALDQPISSIMSGGVVAADQDTAIGEIAELMIDQRIGAVPITDADGRPVGIVSYVDILREVFRE